MFFCCVCEVYRCFVASKRSPRALDHPSAWTLLDVWTVDDGKTGRIWRGSVLTLAAFLHEGMKENSDNVTENANKWSCLSSASGTETVAVPQTDGSYKLHGFKWFTSATDADMTLTLARVQDGTGATTPVFLTSDAPLTSLLFVWLRFHCAVRVLVSVHRVAGVCLCFTQRWVEMRMAGWRVSRFSDWRTSSGRDRCPLLSYCWTACRHTEWVTFSVIKYLLPHFVCKIFLKLLTISHNLSTVSADSTLCNWVIYNAHCSQQLVGVIIFLQLFQCKHSS